MTFHFNDIRDHTLLNKLAIEEAERTFSSSSANPNEVSFKTKFYNSLQGKAAEMYLVENKGMQFLDESTVGMLRFRKDYNSICNKLLYHDLVRDDKIIEVKALTGDISSKIDKILADIRKRTYNFSDYLIVFEFDCWNYTLHDKIKI
jgi:hypothetical protein